ncbi:hypothetical protein ACVIGB_000745 [Bradyrhizobium sp. USDA 4341]
MTNRKVTLEFAETDLPMLADALRTAITVAMMTGTPAAQKRLEHYRKIMDAMIPEGARIFDGTRWSEICMALGEAKSFGVGFEKWGWDSKGQYGAVFVTVGKYCWRSKDYHNYRDTGILDTITSLLEDIAPLDAVRIKVEDTLARHLQPRPTVNLPVQEEPIYGEDGDFEDDDDPRP